MRTLREGKRIRPNLKWGRRNFFYRTGEGLGRQAGLRVRETARVGCEAKRWK